MRPDVVRVSRADNEQPVRPGDAAATQLTVAVIAAIGIDETLLAHIGDAVSRGVDLLEALSLLFGDADFDISSARAIAHELAELVSFTKYDGPAPFCPPRREKGLTQELSRLRFDGKV
jgi:hypothetical protein